MRQWRRTGSPPPGKLVHPHGNDADICLRAGPMRKSNRSDGSLVVLASSHMLVSKITPCLYKCKPYYGEIANGPLSQL